MTTDTPTSPKRFESDEAMKPLIEYIAVGHDENLEKQIIEKSQQPHIRQYTPKDLSRRFGDAAMLQTWLAKGREVHWLVGPDDDLAGIIWYGKEKLPIDAKLPELPEETFAIRIYEGYVGKGLAKPFMKQSIRIAVANKKAQQQPVVGIWLQTDVDNEAAVASYVRFGYQEIKRDDKRVTMVMPAERVLATAEN